MNHNKFSVNSFIQTLLDNHRYMTGIDTRNLINRDDYVRMLTPLIQLLEDFPDQSATFYRKKLEEQSILKKNILNMVFNQKLVSGAIVAYGTSESVRILNTGLTEEGNNQKIDKESIFDLSSISKLFTSIVILCLYRDRYIELDSSIWEYDKRFVNMQNITIRELLSFQRIIKTPVRLTSDISIEEANKIVFSAFEVEKENNVNFYSDIPFMVLRYVIEAVSKTSAFDVIKHYILKPLGMSDTVVTIPQEWLFRAVSSDNEYNIFNDDDPILHVTPLGTINDDKARIFASHGQFAGHAGLFSTMSDMIKFIQAFFGEQLLSRKMLNEIGVNRTGKRLDDGRIRQYLGYGCYSKNPDAKASEVYHPLSGNTIAMSGFTGNHISIDIMNQVFTIIITNRCHNRVSKIVNSTMALNSIRREGELSILSYKSCQEIITSHQFVYQKDSLIRDPALQLAIQNRLIDLIQS
jgi:CubicO group peptidase (beta-lactamase class C family)